MYRLRSYTILTVTNVDFQVLLRKEIINAPNVAANDDIAQQYLEEDVANKNDKL